MAVVTDESLRKFIRLVKASPQRLSLKGRSISYFDWMPDRNYAIMGLYDVQQRLLWPDSMQMIRNTK